MISRMRRFTKSCAGFTMIELMVVVIIVGVLAAIAVPVYSKYVKNARVTEASSRLGDILTAEKAFFQEKGVWADDATAGFLGDTATPTANFTYDINSGAGGTGALKIRATGINQMAGPPAVQVDLDVTGVNANGVLTVTNL